MFYFLFKSDFLTIKNVNCSVNNKTSLADEKRWCADAERLLRNKKILSFNLTAVAGELKRKFLPVGDVVVTKKYPQTVAVEIRERKPIVKVSQPGGREYLLDKEGILYSEVVPEFANQRAVTLDLGTELGLGQKIAPEIIPLILLEEVSVTAIKFSGQATIEVKAGTDLTLLFSREKNLDEQLRALQTVLKKYRIEGKQLKSVDLRYEQVVVRY